MGSLSAKLLQFIAAFSDSEEDPQGGWLAALTELCTRPPLIAIVGDGTGFIFPDFVEDAATALPVVEVTRGLSWQLERQQFPANCVPATQLPGGVLALWRNTSDAQLTPLKRVAEWPDLVVQVGVTPIAPDYTPVPIVRAPLDWSTSDAATAASEQLAEQVVQALAAEQSRWLAAQAAAINGWHRTELQALLMEVTRGQTVG